MNIGKLILSGITIIVAIGFLISGYSVGLDPRTWLTPVLFSMTFPVWIGALVVMTLLAIIFRGKWAIIICLLTWIGGWSALLVYCPWNSERKAEDGEPTFMLMTYNIYQLRPVSGKFTTNYNPTIQSILESGADIVMLQECPVLDKPIASVRYSLNQRDSIVAFYPYRSYSPSGLAVLSKYPLSKVNLPEEPDGTAKFAAWETTIHQETVTLYNIHLQSFELSAEDKAAYRELVDAEVSRKGLDDAKNDIIPKVSRSLRFHAAEAQMLIRDINSVTPDGKVIVAGDFNDVPGCYAIKELCRACSLKDAWRNGGFGLTYTYHGSKFYFHIDHILYRDFTRPLITKRLKVPGSDHYPVISIFSLKAPQ